MSSKDSGTWIAGRYELVAPAGTGGMANVWRGLTHGAAGFTRKVAIKRVLPALEANEQFTAMFVEEARVVSELQHPNIVQVHDFDRDSDGRYFLVMEWVEGLDLEAWLRAYALASLRSPWHLVTAIAIEVLRALGAAHGRIDEHGRPAPVIHRDVNPANILLAINGIVKLTDFGLARRTDRARMTSPNIVKGKLSYLAPELLDGEPATQRSDLYAVGIVLWEALSGRRLFAGSAAAETVLKVQAGEVPPLAEQRSDLPSTVCDVVACALERHAENRYESAEEMMRALATILRSHPEPTDARPLAWSVRRALARLREHDASEPR
jgi:serine/threonine-protein kinase